MSLFESTISVIVPVYGTEMYLKRCIDSLLNQSYKNLEIIVVNDGSKGNVAQIMTEYAVDKRIVFVDNKENRGLLRARVCGAQHATGEYIAFLDSDDYVSFDFYRTLIYRAKETESDIVVGKTVWENNGERYVYNYHEAALSFDVLKGDSIKEAFFGQEYQCYSWHTVWNKLYKKTLWDKCAVAFEAVKDHVIMTEDIFFSSLLFYNADVVSRVSFDAYFYCVNETASTHSENIKLDRFLKNLKDISFVFNSVEDYLRENKASEDILEKVRNGCVHYARMWNNLAVHSFLNDEKDKALEAVKSLAVTDEECSGKDYFYESVKTAWGGGLEYIKEQISNSEAEYISFDVFDTLIKRPFYDPRDMFLLLDETFSEITGNIVSFSKIRIEAEDLARAYYGEKMSVEDITLDEIYEYIANHYGIPRIIAKQMKELECENELKFCEPRQSGKVLLQLAAELGKHVILISDMYLSKAFIERLMEKCNISEYEHIFVSSEERCLKYNGHLFMRALSELDIETDRIIHIGDSWKSDIEGSKEAGIKSIFLPKTTEVFENRIQGCVTNRCSDIGKSVCGENVDYEKTCNNLGIRCMKAMVANFYFDNPYRTFNDDSDFNMDPFFMGFYLVGMHSLGLSKWIKSELSKTDFKRIVFLARDGFLPMKAFLAYARGAEEVETSYVQASRKAVLPIMVRDGLNLYQLPIEYRAHTPNSLSELLGFLGKTNKNFWKDIESVGLVSDKAFTSIEEYHNFIKCFYKNCYDEEKHKKAKVLAEKYYQTIPEGSIAFDMGYSGRIQAAICEASGKKIDVFFLHEDYCSSARIKQFAKFGVFDFYDFVPSVSGLIREHIFSDTKGSCIGFEEKRGTIIPVFEKDRHDYVDKAVVDMLQNGALDFVRRFSAYFNSCEIVHSFSKMAASLPFEGFLRKPSRMDMHIFSESYFEDMVYGANEKINIETFVMNYLNSYGWSPKTKAEFEKEKADLAKEEAAKQENERILTIINSSSQRKRALAWLLLDKNYLKEKLRIHYPKLFK